MAQLARSLMANVATGRMSKTEAQYYQNLRLRCAVGEIVRYDFEAVSFVAGWNNDKPMIYTPDFQVVTADGVIEFHEVKPHKVDKESGRVKVFSRNDSIPKAKSCALLYPMYRWLVAMSHPTQGWILDLLSPDTE